jgi:hypothetical protein
MSIPETVSFDNTGKALPKGRGKETFGRVFLALVILLVGLLGFGVGKLSQSSTRPPVKIEYDPNIISAMSGTKDSASVINATQATTSIPIPANTTTEAQSGSVYASSKGTKYYYPNCKSAVSAANKVTFTSASLAEKAGYTLASGCHK